MLNLLILVVCVYIAYRVREARKRKVAPWCNYHSHELTHTNTLVSIGTIREAKRSILKHVQALAPHEVRCYCDQAGTFEWHKHNPTCPRYQVGMMLKDVIERVR